jgi:Na+(H+)/acetate symporter ActP
VARAVELAFAVAASTFFPLLLLGIWWKGLTPPGAIAGLTIGGGLSATAVIATLAGYTGTGWGGALIAQPAAWTVPIALFTMIGVSLATPRHRPANVVRTMVRLHTPERIDVDRGSYDPESAL